MSETVEFYANGNICQGITSLEVCYRKYVEWLRTERVHVTAVNVMKEGYDSSIIVTFNKID